MEKSEETNLPEATAAADENATNGETQPHSQQATQTTQPATQTQNNVAKVKSGLDEGKHTPASPLFPKILKVDENSKGVVQFE